MVDHLRAAMMSTRQLRPEYLSWCNAIKHIYRHIDCRRGTLAKLEFNAKEKVDIKIVALSAYKTNYLSHEGLSCCYLKGLICCLTGWKRQIQLRRETLAKVETNAG